jgi:hypothetical protein
MKKAIILSLVFATAFFSCDEAIGLFPFPGLGPENLNNPNDLDGDSFLFPLEDNHEDIWVERSTRSVSGTEKIYFSAHIPNVHSYRVFAEESTNHTESRPSSLFGPFDIEIFRENGSNPDNWFTLSDVPGGAIGPGDRWFYQVQVVIFDDGTDIFYGGTSDVGEVFIR